MDKSVEIRKLDIKYRCILSEILELGDSWKQLMSLIPKTLEKNNYVCDISDSNPAKYRSDHISLLEQYAFQQKLHCAEILFHEWGTSGRVRPALGHLLYLLQKAHLYRAADYVAIDILGGCAPPRPSEGFGARITLQAHERIPVLVLPQPNSPNLEGLLENMRYPGTSDLNRPSIHTNVNYSKPSNNVESRVPTPQVEASDMIKFSKSEEKPHIEEKVHSVSSEVVNFPDLSILCDSSNTQSDIEVSENDIGLSNGSTVDRQSRDLVESDTTS